MNPQSGINLILYAAELVEQQDRDIQSKLQDTGGEELQTETDKVKPVNLEEIPFPLLLEYFSKISHGVNKYSKYCCTFSPICYEVIESNGNKASVYQKMKRHLINHHFLKDSYSEIENRMKQNKTFYQNTEKRILEYIVEKRFSTDEVIKEKFKNTNSLKNDKFLPCIRSRRNLSHLQPPILKEANAHVSNYSYTRSKMSITKQSLFGHDYAKPYSASRFNAKSAKETGQKKQEGITSSENESIINHIDYASLSYRPAISDPFFPFLMENFSFLYIPDSFIPAQIVELNSNGEPILFKEPAVQPLTRNVLFENTFKNYASRKKRKTIAVNSTSRSVLECVENRVACNSNFIPDQRDALLPDDSIENSENVEKSDHDIAWRNIQALSQQRRKRKCRDKPTVYVCNMCQRSFTANTSLTYHYMSHYKIKPFECHICDKSFTRRHSLKYHMMIHDNKNRFQCPTCKRLFRHPSHYKEHLRKHSNEEPFSCKFCSNKFKTHNSFKRHLKMQHQKLLTSNGIEPIHNDA